MLLLHATHAVETSNVVLLLAQPPSHVVDPVEPAPHMHARVMPAAPELSVVYVAVAQETSVVHVAVAQETSVVHVVCVVHVVHVDHPKSLTRKPLLVNLIPCISTTQ